MHNPIVNIFFLIYDKPLELIMRLRPFHIEIIENLNVTNELDRGTGSTSCFHAISRIVYVKFWIDKV